eukprot:1191472-Prymnesium_polylepis.1
MFDLPSATSASSSDRARSCSSCRAFSSRCRRLGLRGRRASVEPRPGGRPRLLVHQLLDDFLHFLK